MLFFNYIDAKTNKMKIFYNEKTKKFLNEAKRKAEELIESN